MKSSDSIHPSIHRIVWKSALILDGGNDNTTKHDTMVGEENNWWGVVMYSIQILDGIEFMNEYIEDWLIRPDQAGIWIESEMESDTWMAFLYQVLCV